MADYIEVGQTQNNYERKYNSVNMELRGQLRPEYTIRDSAGEMTPAVNLKIDDAVIVGKLPQNSMVMNCRIAIHEAFKVGTTINLYHSTNATTNTLTTLATGLVVGQGDANIVDGVTMHVQLPYTGQVGEDGATLTTGDGGIWIDHYIVAVLKGADVDDADPVGLIDIVFDYTKMDTNNGSFSN